MKKETLEQWFMRRMLEKKLIKIVSMKPKKEKV